MDVEALNEGLSPNIHRSMAVASHGPITCFKPVFVDSLIDRFSSCVPEASETKAYLEAEVHEFRRRLACRGRGRREATGQRKSEEERSRQISLRARA